MENNLSFIEIETGLKNCLNSRLNKQNINSIRGHLNSLNSKRFNYMLLSKDYLKNLINSNRARKRVSEIIKKSEFKKVIKNNYIKEFKGTGILKSKKQICFLTL